MYTELKIEQPKSLQIQQLREQRPDLVEKLENLIAISSPYNMSVLLRPFTHDCQPKDPTNKSDAIQKIMDYIYADFIKAKINLENWLVFQNFNRAALVKKKQSDTMCQSLVFGLGPSPRLSITETLHPVYRYTTSEQNLQTNTHAEIAFDFIFANHFKEELIAQLEKRTEFAWLPGCLINHVVPLLKKSSFIKDLLSVYIIKLIYFFNLNPHCTRFKEMVQKFFLYIEGDEVFYMNIRTLYQQQHSVFNALIVYLQQILATCKVFPKLECESRINHLLRQAATPFDVETPQRVQYLSPVRAHYMSPVRAQYMSPVVCALTPN